MATRVYESAIIATNPDAVWAAIKPLDFHFLPIVTSVELEDKHSTFATVGTIRRVTYADKTVQRVKLVELSDAQRFVTWEVIDSVPALTYSSAIHTIKLRRVTEDGHTFIEFTSDYAKDAKNDVIVDSKFKKLEFFKAVAAVTESRCSQFLKQIDFSTFTKLTGPQIDAAWAAFDTDKNGTLEPAEVEKVVEIMLVKIASEQSAVHKQLQSMFEVADSKSKLDEKAHAPHAPHAHHPSKHGKDHKSAHAPGHAEGPKSGAELSKHVLAELKKKTKGVAKSLIGQLDRNRDGKIDKSEFTVLFPSWFERVVTDGVRAAYF